MRILFIAMLLIGLGISAQSLRFHCRTEAAARSIRNDLAAIRSDSNADQIDSAVRRAFADLTLIKRAFKPIAYAGVALSVLSALGLFVEIRTGQRAATGEAQKSG